MKSILILLLCVCFLSVGYTENFLSEDVKKSLTKYCLDCHDSDLAKGELDLEPLLSAGVAKHSEIWEKVIRQIDARQMPPIGKIDTPF